MKANNFNLKLEIKALLSVQSPMFCRKMCYISLRKVKTQSFTYFFNINNLSLKFIKRIFKCSYRGIF
jgi:hypothetical protein